MSSDQTRAGNSVTAHALDDASTDLDETRMGAELAALTAVCRARGAGFQLWFMEAAGEWWATATDAWGNSWESKEFGTASAAMLHLRAKMEAAYD